MLSSAASALLHAVDDRELGVALLGLLEQPLRLVEQSRVLERDAHAAGERLEQTHVGLAEGMLALACPSARVFHASATHESGTITCVFGAERRSTTWCEPYRSDCRFMFSSITSVLRVRITWAPKPVCREARRRCCTSVVVVRIHVVHAIGLRVHDAGYPRPLMKDLAKLVADGLVDALQTESAGERLLHALDDGELRREPRDRVVGRAACRSAPACLGGRGRRHLAGRRASLCGSGRLLRRPAPGRRTLGGRARFRGRGPLCRLSPFRTACHIGR